MQGIPVRAVVTKAPVEFNSDSPKSKGGNEVIDQHAGEHAHHEGHNLIGTPQQMGSSMVLGMATGSIMISVWDGHYFDESDGLVGCNKYRYCEFIVMNCIINCALKTKQSYLTGSVGGI
jgi:hypothetical protein